MSDVTGAEPTDEFFRFLDEKGLQRGDVEIIDGLVWATWIDDDGAALQYDLVDDHAEGHIVVVPELGGSRGNTFHWATGLTYKAITRRPEWDGLWVDAGVEESLKQAISAVKHSAGLIGKGL